MSRKPSRSPVICEFFTWRLFTRDAVYYADGRNKKYYLGKHSLATRDPKEALENLRLLDRRKAIELGLAVPTAIGTTNQRLVLSDGWELFLAYCQRGQVMGGASKATYKRYRAVRDKHVRFCATKGLQFWEQIDKTNTEQYGNWLGRQERADRTIYLELTLVKSIVGWLIGEGHLPETRRINLPLRKPTGTDTYCYRQEEVVAMVCHCRSRADLHWLEAVIIALACTGLRISELAALRWTDVDFRSRTILLTDDRSSSRRKKMGKVRTTKGGRDRTLPIHSELFKRLQEIKHHPDGRIFHGPLGGALKPDTVRNVFIRDVIESLKLKFPTPPGEIGFEHGRIHSFRHYFCSQAFLSGAAAADIQEWLGHQDSKMVAHYRHLRPEDSQRKVEAINFLGRDDRSERRSG
jgi:integrase